MLVRPGTSPASGCTFATRGSLRPPASALCSRRTGGLVVRAAADGAAPTAPAGPTKTPEEQMKEMATKLQLAQARADAAEKAVVGFKIKTDRLKEALGKAKKKERAKKNDEDFTALSSIASRIVISKRGLVEPVVTPGAKATVFAILDDFKRIMYVGWSFDFKNALRRILIRQPRQTQYYMSADVAGKDIDAEHMDAAVRSWYSELGGPPLGNKTPETIAQWVDPYDTFEQSDDGSGGDIVAADARVASVMDYLRGSRGMKERYAFDPNAMQSGIVKPMDSFIGSNSARYTKNYKLQPPEVRALEGDVTVEDMPQIKDMASRRIVTKNGDVDPVILPGTRYSCFAVLDLVQKVQFVGISQDLRNTLRKILARQPEKAFFYMSVDMANATPDQLAAVQAAWVAEMDGIPAGNTPEFEAAWTEPIVGGTTAAAGAAKLAEIKVALARRGLKETFEYDPALLAQGLVEVLPSKAASRVLAKTVAQDADGDEDDELDMNYYATRNHAERGTKPSAPEDVAAWNASAAAWITSWRGKTKGEASWEGNPAPALASKFTVITASSVLPPPVKKVVITAEPPRVVLEPTMPEKEPTAKDKAAAAAAAAGSGAASNGNGASGGLKLPWV